ncbi:MAG: hypothetical protein IJK92_02185 [Bacteroidales bacterium]|nr:hypothetical protein [Bacteroidales bacterium]
MSEDFAIKLFENKQVRVIWDAEKEKYFFSVVDVVEVLTESPRPRKYWNALKTKLKEEGDEVSQKLGQLKLQSSDGKKYLTDVADLQEILRIIQSIPSPKAEPLKRWLAEIGAQRIDQMIDPEQTFQMAVEDYRRQGYSDRWINERMKSIKNRKELTDEWERSGVHDKKDFAILTNVLTKAWSGMTTGEYKQYKELTKQNLRDNMTSVELALNSLAEVATTEISRQRNPKGFEESRKTAQAGGRIAKNAREDLEREIGHSIVSSSKASDFIAPTEDVEAKELTE